MKKQVEFWEVSVKFIVRKGSDGAECLQDVKRCVEKGIGGNDMECLEAEEVKVSVE